MKHYCFSSKLAVSINTLQEMTINKLLKTIWDKMLESKHFPTRVPAGASLIQAIYLRSLSVQTKCLSCSLLRSKQMLRTHTTLQDWSQLVCLILWKMHSSSNTDTCYSNWYTTVINHSLIYKPWITFSKRKC